MNSLMLLFSAAAMAAAPAQTVPVDTITLSEPVKHDVQCFMLSAIALQRALAGNDDKVKQAGGLGVMYFFTKLKIEAPTLDLFETIKQQAGAMGPEAQIKAVAQSCDTEFQQQGAALQTLGQRLKDAAPHSSPSS
jgi:hypothetical protein